LRLARGAAALLTSTTLVAASARCVLLSHSGDFTVAPATVDTRLCAMCAGEPTVRSVPCAPASQSDDAGGSGDGIWLFALQSIDLGATVPTDGGAYAAGLSLDCDPRPTGVPTLCAATAVPFAGATWPVLPGGVENSFGAVTLATLARDPALHVDVQSEVNRELLAGEWGMMLLVDHWDGTPNDDAVGVRLFFTKGFAANDGGTTPAWDGTDSWYVVADGWDPAFPSHDVPDTTLKASGYVTNGELVWDGRAIVGAELRLRDNGGLPPVGGQPVVGAYQVMSLDGAELVGALTPNGLTGASFGATWPGSSINVSLPFLAGCDPMLATAIQSKYGSGGDFLASDLPGTSADAGAACTAASVGFGMTFVRAASIAGPPVPFPPPPSPACQPGGQSASP
jgi:hypothetical protein